MSPPLRLDAATLQEAVQALCERDPALAELVARDGIPPLWPRPEGFVTLARIVLEQRVSLESAASLFRRLDASIPGGLNPEPLMALGADGHWSVDGPGVYAVRAAAPRRVATG